MKRPRQIRVDGDVAYVPLTRGYEAIIDAVNVHLVKDWNWCAQVCPRTVYATRGVRLPDGTQKTIMMHRQIMRADAGIEVDHIDCDGLNNRMGNMRLASKSQNQMNARVRRSAKSDKKGVSWHKVTAKWQASITLNGKKRHLGLYKCETSAAMAYARECFKLHGEFARPM